MDVHCKISFLYVGKLRKSWEGRESGCYIVITLIFLFVLVLLLLFNFIEYVTDARVVQFEQTAWIVLTEPTACRHSLA